MEVQSISVDAVFVSFMHPSAKGGTHPPPEHSVVPITLTQFGEVACNLDTSTLRRDPINVLHAYLYVRRTMNVYPGVSFILNLNHALPPPP